MNGLTGFPEAVRAVYPDTRVQLCIVHKGLGQALNQFAIELGKERVPFL